MKKKLVSLISALVLSVASLSALPLAKVLAAAPYTCTWTGSGDGTSFSDASNWSGCNSAAPQAGDNDSLVFDNTDLSSDTTINNDISGLNVGNITFQGSANYSYIVTGNAFSIGGGITDTTRSGSEIDNDITLTADQTFGATQNNIDLDGSVNLSTYNLTLNGAFFNQSGAATLSGSGSLVLDQQGSYDTSYNFNNPSPDFSGSTTIASGVVVYIYDPDSLGSGQVTVASGATLEIQSSNASATLPNNLSLAGSGDTGNGNPGYGALVSCLGWVYGDGCTTSNTTLKLSGAVSLAANAVVVNGAYYSDESSPPTNTATFNFTGDITYNGYTLTAVPSSSTIVTFGSSDSGGSGGSGGSGSGSGSSSSSSKKAPKTPDTGLVLVSSHPLVTLLGTVVLASGVYLLYRKVSLSGKRR